MKNIKVHPYVYLLYQALRQLGYTASAALYYAKGGKNV